MAANWRELCGFAEAEWRHVVIDAFKISRSDAVCLVPDADVSVARHRSIEGSPCGPVLFVWILGIAFKLLERAPVLQHHGGLAKPRFAAEKSTLGIRGEFANHARHRESYWKPFVDLPKAIYTHPNQKDHKFTINLCRHALFQDTWHLNLLIACPSSLRERLRSKKILCSDSLTRFANMFFSVVAWQIIYRLHGARGWTVGASFPLDACQIFGSMTKRLSGGEALKLKLLHV